MIYVIYFFAIIGFLACFSAFIIVGFMISNNKVSHKNDIHFNKPDND